MFGFDRYQRVSPDCLPLSNGKKSNNINGRILHSNTSTKAIVTSSSTTSTSCSTLEGKGFRFRSPSRTQDHHNNPIEAAAPTTSPQSDNNHDSPPPPPSAKTQRTPSPSASPSSCGGTTTGACGGSGGDMLLQWGQRKRARVSRTEIRALTDDSSSSSSAAIKAQRKSSSTTMPPPPPPPLPSTSSASNVSRPRREASAFLSNRYKMHIYLLRLYLDLVKFEAFSFPLLLLVLVFMSRFYLGLFMVSIKKIWVVMFLFLFCFMWEI